MKRPDALTGDLFAVPVPVATLPGEMDFDLTSRQLLSDAVKGSPHNAHWIASRMSELTGERISADMLHSWTAPSRGEWRFPLKYLPAFEVAAETTALTAWLASVRGGQLMIGRETLNAELGRLERARDEAAKKIKLLKQQMGEGL